MRRGDEREVKGGEVSCGKEGTSLSRTQGEVVPGGGLVSAGMRTTGLSARPVR